MKLLAKTITQITVTLAGCIALTSHATAAPESVSTLPLQKPHLVAAQAPEYPMDLRKAGKEGEVQIVANLTKEGKLSNIQVVDSTDARFNTATLAVLGEWRYTPAMRDGKAIESVVKFPVRFVLGQDPQPSVTVQPSEYLVVRK
ncbi:MAG: energy transducer TonB [Verrucomicrobiota bacterium]|nr:energy transducer TonB [Verrucomicrobiota bacterium]